MRINSVSHLAQIAVVVLLLCAAPLRGQAPAPAVFDLDRDREAITSLDGSWRFHQGDDPRWAAPAYDDSSWSLLRSDRSWSKQGYPEYGGFAWYRFTVRIPPTARPQALLLTSIYTGYKVYADGQLIGTAGSYEPTRAPVFVPDKRLFTLPVPSHPAPQTIHIAIRVWEYQPVASWAGAGPRNPGSEIGDVDLLQARLAASNVKLRLSFVGSYANGVLAIVVGITVLALFLVRRNEREYLWFAVLILAGAAESALLVAGFTRVPFLMYRLADETIAAISAMAALLFFSTVLRTGRHLGWWLVLVAAALSPLSLVLYYMQWARVGLSYTVQLACLTPAYFWILAELVVRALRRDSSARLLLVPATLLYGTTIFDIVALVTSQLGWQHRSIGETILFRSPYSTTAVGAADIIFVLALLIFLVRRFSLARREEERLSKEVQAARSVQSLLISDTPDKIPGFIVHSAYLPASEVGGDFFHLLPRPDGSLLFLVGDVSGKGLRAAMTVSVIIGALRGAAIQWGSSMSPAEALTHLNKVLYGQIEGFVTCCAILAQPDGQHLPGKRRTYTRPMSRVWKCRWKMPYRWAWTTRPRTVEARCCSGSRRATHAGDRRRRRSHGQNRRPLRFRSNAGDQPATCRGHCGDGALVRSGRRHYRSYAATRANVGLLKPYDAVHR